MGRIIYGYNVLDPLSEDQIVYMWGKHDLIKPYSGKWITWDQYLRRDKLYPYSPTDSSKSYLEKVFNKEKGCYDGTVEIVHVLHPPIYFNAAGEELPGNGAAPAAPVRDEVNMDKFNFYSGGSFFSVIGFLFVLCILCTFFINDGWIIWIPYIIYCIYGYKEWKKYINIFK